MIVTFNPTPPKGTKISVEYTVKKPMRKPMNYRDELLKLMSEISETYYCAGWLSDLEFSLYYAMQSKTPYSFGMGDIPVSDLKRLRYLHRMSGGWWIWDKDKGNVFKRGWKPLFNADEYHMLIKLGGKIMRNKNEVWKFKRLKTLNKNIDQYKFVTPNDSDFLFNLAKRVHP